jgi:hypothetical protein
MRTKFSFLENLKENLGKVGSDGIRAHFVSDGAQWRPPVDTANEYAASVDGGLGLSVSFGLMATDT